MAAKRPGRRLGKGLRREKTRLEEGRAVGMGKEGILESHLDEKVKLGN